MLTAATHVTVTLVSSDCQLAGNTFKVTITTPGNAPVEETLFTEGAIRPLAPAYQLQTNAVFAAGTTIQAQVISGGSYAGDPACAATGCGQRLPDLDARVRRRREGWSRPTNAPDFDDLIIRIDAIP